MKFKVFLASLAVMICAAASAQPQIQSQWNGARVAFLGDSITDANQLPKMNNIYWNILKDILGIEPYVYGINGHSMADLIGQGEKLEKECGQDIDAIFIFLGTNDFNAAVPVGEWYTYDTAQANSDGVVMELRHRSLIYSDDTFKGRMNSALRWVKTHYPDKQIVLLTPIHRGYAKFGSDNVQPPEEFANRCGSFIDEYVDAVKEAGSVWSLPVIDLNSVCGLLPTLEEHVPYFRNAETDHLHPNTAGQYRMAWSLAYQMMALPARFPKYVALSFDDGPNLEITPRMLDIFEEHGIKASFFVIGSKISRKTAPVLRRMAQMGCDVENHTYKHPRLTEIDDERVLEEVAKTDALIEKYTGSVPRYLRPPYIALNKHNVEVIGGKVFISGLSVGDWQAAMPAQQKVDSTLAKVKDGDILLFHDTSETTLEAIRMLVPILKARGFEFVTVPELFALRSISPADHTPKVFSNVYR
jgi:Predicted xylanase/chitin deacetylase